MSAHSWYDVNVTHEAKGPIAESAVACTLDSAKSRVADFRKLYPTAALIFVRLHFHKAGRPAVKILHSLTVSNGMTADERRKRAIESNDRTLNTAREDLQAGCEAVERATAMHLRMSGNQVSQ